MEPMDRQEALDTMLFFLAALSFASWNKNKETWEEADRSYKMIKEILETQKLILKKLEELK